MQMREQQQQIIIINKSIYLDFLQIITPVYRENKKKLIKSWLTIKKTNNLMAYVINNCNIQRMRDRM